MQEHHLHLPRRGGDLHLAPLHRPMVITSDRALSIILPVVTPCLVDAALHLLVLAEPEMKYTKAHKDLHITNKPEVLICISSKGSSDASSNVYFCNLPRQSNLSSPQCYKS